MAALDDYNAQLGRVNRNAKTLLEALESAISEASVPNGSVTNAKLATDVKVGSLAALTTSEKGSVQGSINELDGEIGALSSLTTTEKGSIVGAANELDGEIGVLSSLTTAEKGTVVGAINEVDAKELELATATPVNAVAAAGVLTLTGVVIDGETGSIGSDVYEFCADTAQSLTAGSDFAVDIESNTTKSAATLTVDTQPTSGDTMTLGSKVFTFVPDGTENADGEVSIGTNLATAQANIVAAINGSDGVSDAHTQVSAAAFAANDSVITALIGGVAGDSIASTETFTAGTNVFDAATLGITAAGADCTAANAITALVTSVTANDTEGVGAADGAGDTVDLTADTKGTAGNAITTTEVMANATFGAATLESGVNGTVGLQWAIKVDASYLYIAVAANTIADDNWRRVSLGSAY